MGLSSHRSAVGLAGTVLVLMLGAGVSARAQANGAQGSGAGANGAVANGAEANGAPTSGIQTERGQTNGTAASQGSVTASPAQSTQRTTTDGVLVDQVIGVVNGDLVLESDVEEERRFSAFQPLTSPGGRFSRDRAIERLVDRTLILQQAKLQPDDAVSVEEAKQQLGELRKAIPACKQYGCETDAGWEKFVRAQGFTQEELLERWRERMQILKFIEVRFRMGIRISPEEIKAYYDKTLLPAYAQQGVAAPKLDTISDRVQEVLLQQQVGSLLGDWLKSLKAQGTVRMARPGEVQP